MRRLALAIRELHLIRCAYVKTHHAEQRLLRDREVCEEKGECQSSIHKLCV